MALKKPLVVGPTGLIEQLAGSDSIFEFLPFVPPVAAAFTGVNMSSATLISTALSLSLLTTPTGSDSCHMQTRSLPSTPYAVRAAMSYCAGLTTAYLQSWSWWGMVWRDSGSGKLVTFGVITANGTVYLAYDKWSSATTWNSTYFEIIHPVLLLAPTLWLSMEDNGFTRQVSISADGVNYIPIHSTASNTDYCTPDQIGFFNNGRNTATVLNVWSWNQ